MGSHCRNHGRMCRKMLPEDALLPNWVPHQHLPWSGITFIWSTTPSSVWTSFFIYGHHVAAWGRLKVSTPPTLPFLELNCPLPPPKRLSPDELYWIFQFQSMYAWVLRQTNNIDKAFFSLLGGLAYATRCPVTPAEILSGAAAFYSMAVLSGNVFGAWPVSFHWPQSSCCLILIRLF